jgi:hypothetical protein
MSGAPTHNASQTFEMFDAEARTHHSHIILHQMNDPVLEWGVMTPQPAAYQAFSRDLSALMGGLRHRLGASVPSQLQQGDL